MAIQWQATRNELYWWETQLKRLRNGQKYGFVRFKYVRDVEGLLDQLWKIKIGEEWLRIYVAFDRRSYDKGGMGDAAGDLGSRGMNPNNDGRCWKGINAGTCDKRRFVDVINEGSKRDDKDSKNKAVTGVQIEVNGIESTVVGMQGNKRVIEVEEKESNARAFRAGTKPDFVLRGTLHPTGKWAEEDNEVDPDELARVGDASRLWSRSYRFQE
ncbi:hypothetical protein Tco_0387122 [Tanacetum coccineum]